MAERSGQDGDDLLDWLRINDPPNWKVARPLGTVLGAILVVAVPLLFLGAIFAASLVLFDTIRNVIAGNVSGPNLGAGAVIAALLGAPFLVWGTWVRHRTLGFQKEGHITDRINKAVEMLGAEKTVKVRAKDVEGQHITVERTEPNIEVRLGAILSLERIAQDSIEYDRGRDHVRVMEILCAYVRQNAPASSAEDGPLSALTSTNDIEQKRTLHSDVDTWAHRLPPPRQDIEIALKVIGGRSVAQRAVERMHRHWNGKPYRPDLSRCNLQKANLEDLDLSGTNFFKCRLEGAYCARANLRDSNFVYASLTRLSGPDADFNGAKLSSTDFSFGLLDRTSFRLCDFGQTFFVGAQLPNSVFVLPYPATPDLAPVNGVFLIDCNKRALLLEGWIGSAAIVTFGQKERLLAHDYNSTDGVAFRNAVLSHEFFGQTHTQIGPDDLKLTFGDGSTTIVPDSRPAHWPTWRLPDSGEHSFEAEWAKWRSDPAAYVPPPGPTG